jgi:hypothetical protein
MLRELDQRKGGGLTVTLEWDSETGDVQVRCEDEHSSDRPLLCYRVRSCDARRAFLHPFATCALGDTQRTLEHDLVAAPDHECQSEPADDRRRRWYQARASTRRSADQADSNVTWWPL